LDFGLFTIAVAAGDASYTNVIAPYQRLQAVSGPVCLHHLPFKHAHARWHLLACLPALHIRPIAVNSMLTTLCCIGCGFGCLHTTAADDSISINAIPSHSRSQAVSGPDPSYGSWLHGLLIWRSTVFAFFCWLSLAAGRTSFEAHADQIMLRLVCFWPCNCTICYCC